MNFDELYEKIKSGEISKEEARKKISLEFIKTAKKSIIDVNRELRTGIPEIIYGEYKSLSQVIEIIENSLTRDPLVIVSRFPDNKKLETVFKEKHPVLFGEKISVIGDLPDMKKPVLVISGGAADHSVAEEIEICLKALGNNPLMYEDRGIAHPTRVLEAIEEGLNQEVKVIIVIAGMEGALSTFVSSFVALPVIGVPTSIGYGYNAKQSALIAMLSACTPNLAIVNIDGGIRAAVIASLIANN